MKKRNFLFALMAIISINVGFLFGTAHAEDGLAVTIFTPTNAEITSNNNILFSFEGTYPDTHVFKNYEYEIERVRGGYTTGGRITTSGFQSFVTSLEDGRYTFAVTLNTTNGGFSPYKKESRGFIVNDDVDLNIISPYSYEVVDTINTSFEREGEANTFDHYEYEIESNDASYYYTGRTENIDDTNLDRNDLPDGLYTFTVRMFYTGGHYIEDSRNFEVELPTSLSITSPIENQVIESSNHTFTWNGSHPYKDKFCYELKRNGGGYITKSDCTTNTSLIVSDLIDGNYTFKVTMEDSRGNELNSLTRNFSVHFDRSLVIPNITTVRQKQQTFTWDGSAEDFNSFTYTLEGVTNGYYTGNTTTDNSFTVSDLIDGRYTLTVTMNCDGDTVTQGRMFDVYINKTLSVNTDPSGIIRRNNVTGVNVAISWEGDNDWFGGYNYELKRNGVSRDTGTHPNKVGNKLYEMLPSGTYTFHIDMISSRDGSVITGRDIDFEIIIPTTLTLNSPTLDGNNVTLGRTGFDENFDHYEYSLDRTDSPKNVVQGTRSTYHTGFTIQGLHYGNYTLAVNMKDSGGSTLTGKNVSFQISDNLSLSSNIYVGNTEVSPGSTINSRSATFTRSGQSEDLAGFYYEISGTTFKNETYKKSGIQTSNINGELYKAGSGSILLEDLQTGTYRFTVKMLSGNSEDSSFNERFIDFNVFIPASLTITSPSEGATITSSNVTFSWTGYNDVITRYEYNLSKVGDNLDQNNITTNTSFSRNLSNGNYVLTVWISSGGTLVAEDTIHFTVAVPPKVTGGSSGKTHYTNNLKLSLENDSPSTNEWIKLIVKIDDSYVGKVTFPKLQHYSADTEKREDIPVTSKNYVSDYSDDAKLGYIKFSSSDDGRKDLEQFIKFYKNGYYRIYAEDKDGYDTYVEFKVSGKTTQTSTTTSENNNTVNNTNTIDNIIQQYIPEVYTPQDTSEEVYIARSCKKYTIRYSDSLNVYTSPNLNMSEYFVSKDYFKRYVDSKNKYQSGCPTNIGWISTNYSDKTNDDSRYTAPNGKVYFITGRDGNYYSNELNKELKTPTSFKTIQELKYYIRDRNPLINMATLGPVN